MKRIPTAIAFLAAGFTLLTSCSSDIVVKSDLNESTTVKKSAISSYTFNKSNAIAQTEKSIQRLKSKLKKCSTYLSESDCEGIYNKDIKKMQNELEKVIPDMPDIRLVRYRTIYTNVNGDKLASGYKHVACIPAEEANKQLKWFEIATRMENIESIIPDSEEGIQSNLIKDGTVASNVRIEVCKRYGNI